MTDGLFLRTHSIRTIDARLFRLSAILLPARSEPVTEFVADDASDGRQIVRESLATRHSSAKMRTDDNGQGW